MFNSLTKRGKKAREAKDHYEIFRPKLGEKFLDELAAAISFIRSDPRMFGIYRNTEARVCRLHRFPFNVFYLPQGDVVWILAVGHQHRRPDYWRRRLRGLE